MFQLQNVARLFLMPPSERRSRIVRVNSPQPDRDADILRLRESGRTLRQVAIHFGLTREGIRRICIHERRRQDAALDPATTLPILDRPLRSLPFSARTKNCFNIAGLDDTPVRDLTQWTDNHLLQMKNFGRRSLEEVQTFLQSSGLSLKTTPKQTFESCPHCHGTGRRLSHSAV